MNLRDKVIVVTGSSKGLGKELARLLVLEGAKVVVSARTKPELARTAHEIDAVPFSADVTNERHMISLAKFVKKRFGRIDIWINNAGITIPHSTIEGIDPKVAHQVFEINFFGTFYGSRAAISVMKKQPSGTLLNIISMSALVGRPRSLIYSASKWAVRGFNEGLRLSKDNGRIQVLSVHPGGMKTTIFGKHLPKGYEGWMDPSHVAKKIIRNLRKSKPRPELIINDMP